MLDENFLKRVYKMTLLLWLLSIGLCLLGGMWKVALGLTLGVFLSLTLLYSLEWIVKRAFASDNHRPRSSLIKFTLLKYPLIIVFLYFLVRWSAVNLSAFCLGISMPYLVIFLKALGTILVERTQISQVGN